MRTMRLAFLVAFLMAGSAQAQTTSCSWVGNVWTCHEQNMGSGIQWQNGVMPNAGATFMEAFNRARREKEEAERARLEAERLAAERNRPQSQSYATQQGAGALPPSSYGQAWLASANQRRHLFPDFDKVVFAPDVRITDEMVMLMSSSPYAADIAYYLATHKAESLAISRLPLLDAARAIDGIERQIKVDQQSGK